MGVHIGRVKTYRQWELKLSWGHFVLRFELHAYWQGVGLILQPWVDMDDRTAGMHVSAYTLFGGLSVDLYTNPPHSGAQEG